jgi:Rrf2 family protein
MDILRRNADYALRMMFNLAMHWEEGLISTRAVSSNMDIPYHLACKLMQKLQKASLVESNLGPNGGFKLKKAPSKINFREIIEATQGPMSLNRCLVDASACERQCDCPVNKELAGLQEYIVTFLSDATLDRLLLSNKSDQT